MDPDQEGRSGLCFGSCSRCREAVNTAEGACRAMGRVFHVRCFTCSVCNKQLRGKPFFTVSNRIYCEEDFLFSGVHPPLELCSTCGRSVTDLVLQACGRSYHPSCFRCVVCSQELQGQPFAADSSSRVYCIDDYHRVQAPRCAACHSSIVPTEGSTESIRVASSNQYFHVECYAGEVNLI
ncbi:LIM domain-containing protein 1 [Oryzias melastigma]|uniref:LIM domain-containing protein 1 n=1 Tax=Oryzias melastigma TaxID=30732 RepID=UPI000CF83C90|nr:LIM domain-containing protein 1 [Oryzias melastigma]XP_024154044.1 LIM domain-containing protein 1 [Oryzias melastigma]